mgnify:CR=1 FL=1
MKKLGIGILLLFNSIIYANEMDITLIKAIENNDYKTVERCLNNGANPDGDFSEPNSTN